MALLRPAQLGDVEVADDHRSAGFDQSAGDGTPDPTGPSGHDRGASVQSEKVVKAAIQAGGEYRG